jgi:hypothetical protein
VTLSFTPNEIFEDDFVKLRGYFCTKSPILESIIHGSKAPKHAHMKISIAYENADFKRIATAQNGRALFAACSRRLKRRGFLRYAREFHKPASCGTRLFFLLHCFYQMLLFLLTIQRERLISAFRTAQWTIKKGAFGENRHIFIASA